MNQRIPIIIAAGLAAGIFFIVPMKGLLVGSVLAIFAPLPLLIAVFGFGVPAGLASGAVGTAVVAGLIDPAFSALFALSTALPAVAIGFVALRRPAGEVLAAIAAIAAVIAMGTMAVAVLRFGSWSLATATSAERILPLLQSMMRGDMPVDLSAADVARFIARAMPVMMAAWGVVTLSFNAWLAARTAQISGLLPQPWANLPDGLRLPRPALAVFVVAAAALAAPDPARTLAATVLVATLCAYSIQGYGALHAMSRGRPGRAGLLATAYLMTVALMPWPPLLAAILGVVDSLARLPRRPLPLPPSKLRQQGDKPWK